MSTTIKVVAPVPPEVTALRTACDKQAETDALARFELAVEQRIQSGINNDAELRIADEMVHKIMLGFDNIEAVTKPEISKANALHKALLAIAKEYKGRWQKLRDRLETAILKYGDEKKLQAEREQAESDRAARELREQKQREAKAALRNGDMKTAQQLMEEARSTVAPVLMTATPALDHSNTVPTWEITITDPMAVVRAIADGIIPLAFIKEFDEGMAKKEAARRGSLDWPGVQAEEAKSLRVRR